MATLVFPLMAGLLGLGTGIFATLSLIEKPVWALMRAPRTPRVSDAEARAIHAILKRVIHLLPPTMMVAMAGTTVLMAVHLVQTGFAPGALALAAVFFGQLVLIVARLSRDIAGVAGADSNGAIGPVRDGLAALALLHHRGLLMTATSLILLWLLAGGM
jgi:hypothetical protein